MRRPVLRAALLAGLLLLAAVAAAGAATTVTYTGATIVIAQPGSYVLANDAVDSALSTCIEIRAPDVLFDGGGHLVDGRDGAGSVGVRVDGPAGAFGNVTVRNLRARDWETGVHLRGAVDSRVEACVLEGNAFGGAVVSDDAIGDTVADCTVAGNGFGVVLSGGAAGCTVSGSRIDGNEYGLYLSSSDFAVLTRNVVANSSETGVLVSSSGGAVVYDNRFANARNAVLAGEPPGANAWSVAPRAGPNVAGGPNVGGNLWTGPGGSGWSETHADGDRDGFSDATLALAAGNVDEHPLAPSVGYVPTPEPTPTYEDPTPEPTVPWITLPVSPTPAPVPGGAGLPTDPDGDGAYEDVNGNGRADFADVALFFDAMGWIAGNEPAAAFDFNRNGRVDFADVVWLFGRL